MQPGGTLDQEFPLDDKSQDTPQCFDQGQQLLHRLQVNVQSVTEGNINIPRETVQEKLNYR